MSEKLYSLLPTVYRTNDAYNEEPLRGLMKVLESEYSRLDEDVAQLYDNWFIETCEEWVVPYIADLFGLKGVTSSDNASMRAFVSNTIAYRRRKGTPQVLEELARDLLNRPVRIQEFFSLLSHTQHLNHLRLSRTGTCQLRDPDVVRRVDGAFDSSMHIVDVRRPGVGRGRHNLPNLGLSVWRLESFPIERCDALLVDKLKGRYTFDPFGRDVPLFNRERTQFNAFEPMLESDAPSPLHRRQLEEELWALAAGLDDTDGVYFGMQPVFEIFLDGSKEAVLPEDMCIADLSVWRRPTGGMKVAIDPALGRITVADDVPSKVQATHAYGSPGDIGGGPYFERPADDTADDWRDYLVPGEYATIKKALEAIKKAHEAIAPDGSKQARVIVDTNETFGDEPLIVDGVDVQIIAADGTRPCIKATIKANAEKVTLRGLWIQGKIEVSTDVHELTVTDCTVLNGTDPALSVPDPHDTLRVEIESCALGPCSISSDAEMFSIRDSIVHADDAEAIAGPNPPGAPPLSVQRCTILGSIATKQLELLSESIVTGKITVERTQIGCARFSWVRPGSRTPRRYRCQPDMEIDRLTALSNNEDRSPHVRPATLSTRPRFQSITPGQPAFGQLGLGCPDAVRYGAEDEGEMGCWHKLYEQERYLNLRSAIGEYVRFGLDYGIIERT